MKASLWDRGLQNERTTLSWHRTLLGLLACGALAARSWLEHAALVGVVLLAVTIVVAGLLLLVSRSRYLASARAQPPESLAVATGRMHAVAWATVLLGLMSLVEIVGPSG